MPDAVEERGRGDDDLGVALAHPVVGDHRRRDAAAEEQPRQAQRDVGDDLDVDPRVVGEAQALGVDAGHVPPRLDLQVAVDGLEQLLEAAVAARGRADVDVGQRPVGGCHAPQPSAASGAPRRPRRAAALALPRDAQRRPSHFGAQRAICVAVALRPAHARRRTSRCRSRAARCRRCSRRRTRPRRRQRVAVAVEHADVGGAQLQRAGRAVRRACRRASGRPRPAPERGCALPARRSGAAAAARRPRRAPRG